MLRHEGEAVSAEPNQAEVEHAENEVGAALAYHGGDARAAVATLLDDCRHLRLQLALAEGATSRGMTRGWRPSFERS
ncbi:hypothetical protein AAIH46_17800 [Rhizobium sp. 0TCS1.26]|uniref:hypothetical protein n=1 Tax=Rhizobium sp. 0TCS1.26 TaxID=3142623 RepID=UPI003D27F3E1